MEDERSTPAFTEFDIEEFLDRSHEQERQRLEDELQRIDQELETRTALLDQAVDELESKLQWYVDRLELLYTRSTGKDGERDRLKSRIESFYQDLRDERRTHWRDRQDLLADRRDVRRELDELEETNLLDLF
ncbi:hypothetical protein [Natronobacterium texcoconense]|uniref:Uncharacterized protein n=1 Tax=Natronobacterium texcoconense TaxID=1095778 RepID=A0A1H1AK80_NATTX|nr:hypothetical protein [Natronobacterium texcoconense]SDQ40042.1 hypothetical protein SAMN04489842_0722 [Natronobacterium texcoconense]